ncbi:MAG: hypothetical protein K2H19_02530, partial [Ruminococcus sp.]|nr:hypothetical protein [Ruminococcus sp.]
TIITGIIMALMTAFGFPLSIVSLIPSLFGDAFNACYLICQWSEIILIAVIAGIGCGKYKFCHLILFAIYCFIILGCFIGGVKMINSIPFAIGIIGIIITYPSISAFFDYRQLMNTEGFPYFNHLFALAEDNPVYKPQYINKYYRKPEDNKMPAPSGTVNNEMLKVSVSENDIMPEIDIKCISDNYSE